MERSIMWLAALAAVCVLALPLLRMYLSHLPEAPSCPSCRGITRDAEDRWFTTFVSNYSATVRRACSHCGWSGRMRWRWAPLRTR